MSTEFDWPGWIQAVCAVAAIFTAYWIVRFEEHETKREQLARKLQFAVFSVEATFKSAGAMTAVHSSFERALNNANITEGSLTDAINEHVDRVKALTTWIDELYRLPESYWPGVKMYISDREGYESWLHLFEEIVRHSRREYAVQFKNEREQALQLENSLLEAEDTFLGYFMSHTDAVVAMVETTRKWQVPSRYLERINEKSDGLIERLIKVRKDRKSSSGAIA